MPYEEIPVQRSASQQQNEVAVSGELDASRPSTVLHLGSGRTVVLPTELLLAGLPAQVSGAVSVDAVPNTAPGTVTGRETVIPLVAEQVAVDKRTVQTGTVRLQRDVETFTQTVGLPLTRTAWEIERTPVGQVYTERPEIRQEGDLTIYPLIEERLVAKREYFLVEEVRVRRVETTTDRNVSLELKRDVLHVEREGAPFAAGEEVTR